MPSRNTLTCPGRRAAQRQRAVRAEAAVLHDAHAHAPTAARSATSSTARPGAFTRNSVTEAVGRRRRASSRTRVRGHLDGRQRAHGARRESGAARRDAARPARPASAVGNEEIDHGVLRAESKRPAAARSRSRRRGRATNARAPQPPSLEAVRVLWLPGRFPDSGCRALRVRDRVRVSGRVRPVALERGTHHSGGTVRESHPLPFDPMRYGHPEDVAPQHARCGAAGQRRTREPVPRSGPASPRLMPAAPPTGAAPAGLRTTARKPGA